MTEQRDSYYQYIAVHLYDWDKIGGSCSDRSSCKKQGNTQENPIEGYFFYVLYSNNTPLSQVAHGSSCTQFYHTHHRKLTHFCIAVV